MVDPGSRESWHKARCTAVLVDLYFLMIRRCLWSLSLIRCKWSQQVTKAMVPKYCRMPQTSSKLGTSGVNLLKGRIATISTKVPAYLTYL